MIITIDGPAGTGKSTVAHGVAKALHFVHFDTGAMYRTFTLLAMRKHVAADDIEGLEALLPEFQFDIQLLDGQKHYFLGSEDVSDAIRTREVTALVSQVAAVRTVREGMVEVQRGYAQGNDSVFEGRDLGTVVFPQAELKIFLTARADVRAERRFKELTEKAGGKDPGVSLAEILRDINERDEADRTRKHSPLRQAEDAVLIDTSDLSIQEVIQAVLEAKGHVTR